MFFCQQSPSQQPFCSGSKSMGLKPKRTSRNIRQGRGFQSNEVANLFGLPTLICYLSPISCHNFLTDNFPRIPHDYRTRRNIFYYYSSSANDRVIPHSYSRHNDTGRTNLAIPPDPRVRVFASNVIMGQDCCIERNRATFTYMDTSGVCSIENCFGGDE